MKHTLPLLMALLLAPLATLHASVLKRQQTLFDKLLPHLPQRQE